MTALDLDVRLSPAALRPETLKGRTVAVVDVFRASSTIATALANGARAVVPAADLGEAGRLAATLDNDTVLVGGDRNGEPLDGYGIGNAPADVPAEVVRGKTVVLTTANGTPALAAARAAETTVVASLLNASRAAAFVHSQARLGRPVTLLCAGTGGRIALEDVLCAGLMLSRFLQPAEVAALGDAAQMAYALYAGSHTQLGAALAGATQARRLSQLGRDEDVAACTRLDVLDALPTLVDGRVVIDEAERVAVAG